MKGIIFNLLEEAVTASHGVDAWTTLVEASGANGAYTSLGSYPDAEVIALVDTAATILDCDRQTLLRWFGRTAMPNLSARYAEFFAPFTDTRNFLLSVNDIIHPEVRKLYSGAACPHFEFANEGDTLLVGYRSARGLCDLAHGFMEGASDHYGETVDIHHRQCMALGAESCLIAVSWPGAVRR